MNHKRGETEQRVDHELYKRGVDRRESRQLGSMNYTRDGETEWTTWLLYMNCARKDMETVDRVDHF